MHASIYLFVAASAFTGQTLIKAESISHLDKRSSTNQLLGYVHHSKRQAETEDGPRNGDTFLPQCEATCKIYTDMADKCAGLVPGDSPETMPAVSQAEIMRCACTEEFFGATQACIDCSPQTFTTGDGYDGNMILQQAKEQCEILGAPIEDGTGKTTSGMDADNLKDGSTSAGEENGRIAAGNGDSGRAGSDTVATGNGNDGSATANKEAGEATGGSNEAESDSDMGAGYTVHVQRILAGTTAAMALGAFSFM